MMKFLIGLVVGVCLFLVAGYLFMTRGISMGTSGRPLPGERFVANRALTNSVGKSATEQSPLPADEMNLLAGADIYQHNGCAICHGRLDQPASGVGARLYPHAPHLLPPGKGVTDDPVGTTHWVVKNGIRFSGMPKFGETLTDNQIWQVSLLLHEADKLPAPVQDALHK